MATEGSTTGPGRPFAKFRLSERATINASQDQPWDMIEKMMSNIWSPDNPEGLVHLGVAENALLQQEVATRINNKSKIIPNDHLSYGVGPRGSPRLKKAVASFFNSEFRAREAVSEKQILILPGVMAVLDALTWSICNDGEGIIVPMPFYTGFKPATSARARGLLVPASIQSVEGYRCLDDVFDPEINKKALEDALVHATENGVKVRAVMLTNPHNPLGRCYPVESLKEIARFCGRNDLHLISDEVFAMSVYENPQAANVPRFTSVLALDLDDIIDLDLVHVAYGMGKDFCAAGLHLGVLHSRNEGLIAAVSSICAFGWVPYATQDMWANILEDKWFLTDFITKNREVLAQQSMILRAFLDRHNIPYYSNANAGVFVWVDMCCYLYRESVEDAISSQPLLQSSIRKVHRPGNHEMELFKRCITSGVAISLGSSFSTEELGWFRITFAVEKAVLITGLERLARALDRHKIKDNES